MTTKLVQKHLLKGTQEFEIVDDAINLTIRAPFKPEEKLTVMLTVLNTEPVINKSCLEFTSRVNNEALLSFYLAKPNPDEFNAFINLLKEKIRNEFQMFAGLKSGTNTPELNGNVYEDAPEFNDTTTRIEMDVDAKRLGESIELLVNNMGKDTIGNFLTALEELQNSPENQELMAKVVDEFEALGTKQGAVLTYAPYISLLLADDPFSF